MFEREIFMLSSMADTLELGHNLDSFVRENMIDALNVAVKALKEKDEDKKTVSVDKLIREFECMAHRESLLARGNISQQDLLMQITGTIVHVAMKDEEAYTAEECMNIIEDELIQREGQLEEVLRRQGEVDSILNEIRTNSFNAEEFLQITGLKEDIIYRGAELDIEVLERQYQKVRDDLVAMKTKLEVRIRTLKEILLLRHI